MNQIPEPDREHVLARSEADFTYCCLCDWKTENTHFEEVEFRLEQHLAEAHAKSLTGVVNQYTLKENRT